RSTPAGRGWWPTPPSPPANWSGCRLRRLHAGRGLEPELGHGLLPHLELLDLPGDRHREVGGELHVARDLVVGDLALAVLLQGVLGQGGALPDLDPGHQLLAVLDVGDADHLDVAHVGVGVEELLDLPGVDVLPAPDDHVLDAADDVDVAVLVHGGQVAGVHPARPVDGLGGALRVVPVAGHHRVAPGAQLAGRPPGDDPARLGVGDLHLDVGVDPPHRRHPVLQAVVGRRLGRHRGGLGHAVGDGDVLHVHAGYHLFHDLHRAGRAGHDARPQRGEVEALELGALELGDEHRRHAVEAGAALLGHGPQRRDGLEAGFGDDDGRPVGGAGQVAEDHPEAVVEGDRDADPVGLGVAAGLADEVAVVQDVVVRQRGALGESGRAARVLDVDGVVEL